MFRMVILILLLSSNLANIILQIDLNNDSVDTMAKNINLFTKDLDGMLVLYSWATESLAGEIIKRIEIPLVVVNVDVDMVVAHSLWKFKYIVMICNDPNNLERYLLGFKRTPGMNHRAKYLVFNAGCATPQEYFLVACKNYLVNFALLYQNDLYTYHPYQDGRDCDCPSPIRSDTTTLYPPRKISTFHGCPLRLLAVIYPPYTNSYSHPTKPGFEVMIVRELSRRLNFTMDFVKHPYRIWGDKLDNGTFTHVYDFLESRKGDVLFTLLPARSCMYHDFDLISYYQVFITFFVPAALPVEPWRNLTLAFGKTVWSLVLTSIVVISGTFWLVSNVQRRKVSFVRCVFRSLCIMLSSFNAPPSSWLMRGVFAFWSVMGLLIITLYTANLVNILTNPILEHQISNLEEMVNSKLQFGGYGLSRFLFRIPDNPVLMKIYNDWVPCSIGYECTNRSATRRDIGVLKNIHNMQLVLQKYYTFPSGKPMLYQFKKPTNKMLLSFMYVKGFPMVEETAKVMSRFLSAGLVPKWEKDQIGVKDVKTLDEAKVMVLTVKHLEGAFFVFFIGMGLGLLAFLIEVLMKNKRKVQTQKHIIEMFE